MPRTAEQFLETVHQRRFRAAASDAAAVGLGAGAVAAATFCFSMSMAIVAFTATLAGILARRWFNRADRFTTAADLDLSLNTHDLLTTALFLKPVSDAGFAGQVTAAADARFAVVNPAPLVVARVGLRGWSLSVIAMLAAAVLVFRPHATGVRPADGSPSALLSDPLTTSAEHPLMQQAGPSGRHSAGVIDEPGASTFGQNETTAAPGVDPQQPRDAANQTREFANHPRDFQPGGSTGGGPGRSQTGSAFERQPESTANPVANGGTETGDGRSPGTGGTAVARAGRGAAAGPSESSPWQSSTWTADRQAASTAVANGLVPARSRQMIRDYFDGE